MKRRTNLLLLLAAPSLFAADALPSAESLLDRFAQVTGGKQAYENRKTEFTRGTMEAAAQGLKGTVTRYMDANRNYYSSLEIAGIGMVETGVHDGVAWERSDILGPRIMEGVERAQALREAPRSTRTPARPTRIAGGICIRRRRPLGRRRLTAKSVTWWC